MAMVTQFKKVIVLINVVTVSMQRAIQSPEKQVQLQAVTRYNLYCIYRLYAGFEVTTEVRLPWKPK